MMYEQNENGNKQQNVTKMSSKEITELKSTVTESLKNILEGLKADLSKQKNQTLNP